MRHYELTFIISSELPEQELNSLQDKITAFILEEGGILFETSKKWLGKTLLLVFNAQLKPNNLTNLEKKLKGENKILRSIILAKKPKIAQPAPISPRKTEREKPKQKVEISEIDKKLEEILG